MLYEVVLNSQYLGQNFVNRWNYNSSGDSASVLGSFGLASAIGFISSAGIYPADTMFASIREAVHQETQFISCSVRALRDFAPTDFYETPFLSNARGLRDGEPMTPFASVGFRTTRTRTDIRRATKRFGGLTETEVTAGGNFSAPYTALMETLAERMSAVLTYVDEGNTVTYTPVVCKRNKTVDPEDGSISYPYYPTLAAQLANISSGFRWELYRQVRSQTSRQYGQGV